MNRREILRRQRDRREQRELARRVEGIEYLLAGRQAGPAGRTRSSGRGLTTLGESQLRAASDRQLQGQR